MSWKTATGAAWGTAAKTDPATRAMAEGVPSSSRTTTSSSGSQQCKSAARLEETFTFTSGGGESLPPIRTCLAPPPWQARAGADQSGRDSREAAWAEPAQRMARDFNLPAVSANPMLQRIGSGRGSQSASPKLYKRNGYATVGGRGWVAFCCLLAGRVNGSDPDDGLGGSLGFLWRGRGRPISIGRPSER